MGKSSSPPPDYAAQAQAQADANRDTALYNNNANRVNQITPYGSTTWAIRPGADPNNPQPGDYIQTTTLSPEQQALQSGQNQISQGLNNAAVSGIGRATDAMARPLDTSGLNPYQLAPGTFNLQTGVDRTGLPALTNDFSADRDRVVQALAARDAPARQLATARQNTDLANRGIEIGSTAYSREADRMARTNADADLGYQLAGSQEQSRLLGEARANRGLLGSELTTDMLNRNQAYGQMFGQGLQSSQFNNQARGQQLSELLAMRNLPLNELNALRSGGQVTNPTFSSYYTSGAQAAPIMDAAIAQGNYNNGQDAQNNASANATMGSIAAIAAAMI